MDKVSVILPTYNRANMIERCIKNVFDQDYDNIELIIVDDASTDNTKDVVASLNDSRIKFLQLENNSGGAAAPRNAGLKEATGKYVSFIDSDDEYCEGRISEMVKLMEELDPKPALVFSNFVAHHDGSHCVPLSLNSEFISAEKSFPASVFCPTSCWIINREIIRDEFFDEKIHVIEDCDYFARIARKHPMYFYNKPLVRKYAHGDLTGSVPEEYAEETRDLMLSKWLPEMKKDRKFLIDFYCTMAKDLTKVGKKDKSMKILKEAFKISPFNPRVMGRIYKNIVTH